MAATNCDPGACFRSTPPLRQYGSTAVITDAKTITTHDK